MKKILTTIVLVALLISGTSTQAQHEKGQTNINLGIGFGNIFYTRSMGYTRIFPPISISGDYGVTDDISIGGYLGFTSSTYEYSNFDRYWTNAGGWVSYPYTDTYKWRRYIFGARAAYHFGKFIEVEKLDVYGGIMLGYYFSKSSYSTTSIYSTHKGYLGSTSSAGAAWSLFAGARYRFTDNIGVFGELGYGITIINLGLTIKL